MSNPAVDVQKFGQSLWYDNIQRRLLNDGSFQRLIDESGVLGVTSNPSIFQNAIGNSEDYDAAIAAMIDLPAEEIYEKLAIADIRQAADMLRPVYDRTDALDGYVSLEVSPELAHETDATLAAAKHLFKTVDRPNAMIKIPATPAGLPAITGAIAAGININVTLIFSIENYVAVAEAYIKGLEQRLEAGGDVSKIASVASFFVSRIDAAVDKLLADDSPLQGKTAIANARLAYQEFKAIFYGDRFAKLREAGARVQRPLWASTSTKNPTYPDTLYLDTLIGEETVNTVPPGTLVAFKDHGKAEAATILEDVEGAKATFEQLPAAGVDMAQVTQKLQDDGVVSFANAFKELMEQVEAKRVALNG